MKLRLLDDSIRLRLSQSEVVAVDASGSVEGQTRFPNGAAFRFALEAAPEDTASARFDGGRLVVALPRSDINAWAHDDSAVSLREEIALADSATLKLLVEKDFRCIGGRDDEDQSDLFVNPEASDC